MDINELQDLWGSQENAPQQTNSKSATQNSIDKIIKVENELRRSMRIKTIITFSMFVYFPVLWWNLDDVSTMTTVGYILIMLVMLFYWMAHYFNQLSPTDTTINNDSIQFLKKVKKYYQFRKKLANIGVWIYGVVLGVGITLGTYQFIARGSMLFQSIVLGISLAWIVIGTVWMYRKQTKKYNSEIAPIVEEINLLAKDIEE